MNDHQATTPLGSLTIEFFANSQGRYKFSGTVPIDALITQIELIKAQVIQQQLMQMALAKQQESQQGVQVATQMPPDPSHNGKRF